MTPKKGVSGHLVTGLSRHWDGEQHFHGFLLSTPTASSIALFPGSGLFSHSWPTRAPLFQEANIRIVSSQVINRPTSLFHNEYFKTRDLCGSFRTIFPEEAAAGKMTLEDTWKMNPACLRGNRNIAIINIVHLESAAFPRSSKHHTYIILFLLATCKGGKRQQWAILWGKTLFIKCIWDELEPDQTIPVWMEES